MLLLWSFDAGVRCSSGVRRPSVSSSHNIIGMKSAIFGDFQKHMSKSTVEERADAVRSFPSHFYSPLYWIPQYGHWWPSRSFSLCAEWLHFFFMQILCLWTRALRDININHNENPSTKAEFRPSPLLIQIYRLPPTSSSCLYYFTLSLGSISYDTLIISSMAKKHGSFFSS